MNAAEIVASGAGTATDAIGLQRGRRMNAAEMLELRDGELWLVGFNGAAA